MATHSAACVNYCKLMRIYDHDLVTLSSWRAVLCCGQGQDHGEVNIKRTGVFSRR